MREFIEELENNQKINLEKGLENRVDIDYVIERLENSRTLDDKLLLTRFTNIKDLEEKIKEKADLKVIAFGFKNYYDDNWQDYELMLVVEDAENVKYDLDIWYATTRIGERIIIETHFERYGG